MGVALWFSITLIIYPYLIYPLVIWVIGSARPRSVRRAAYLPPVTILIPAYNEIANIAATIQNKLLQDYPHDKLQIIVISDASSDGTDAVVAGFDDPRVQLLRRTERAGKAAGLNAAVPLATGEILVFSDGNSLFGPNALRNLVCNFADPEVGYVTGSLGFTAASDDLSSAGIGAYMRYENLIRRMETTTGSIIGVNGGVDAIRAELYVDTPAHMITDFILPLTVIARKFRVIFDPLVTAYEVPNTALGSEFRMRVRVALRAMQGLVYMRELLNPVRHPLEAFCLISHKLLRYAGFAFMLVALGCNAALADDSAFYQFLLGVQIGMYGLALVGMLPTLPKALKAATVVPSYLLLSNAAFALASLRFLRGDVVAVWRPRAG
jgi:cellulose synthase/poly-beta-1,6-N-acetylglucosamine synthase-like glycosyltransferase